MRIQYQTLSPEGEVEQSWLLAMTRVSREEDLENEDQFFFDEQTGVISMGPCDKKRQLFFTTGITQ